MADKRVALVTGGSSGIGLASAKALKGKGWTVYTLSRRAEGPAGFCHLAADVSDEEACQRAVDALLAAEGRIDLLVSCAGFGISGAAEFTRQAEAEKQLAVNLIGASNMARAVIPAMRGQGRGRIVHISSVAAVAPIPFQAWYSAGKAALNSYSMALHNEVARFGISVCAVMPGDTATGFTAARKKQVLGDDVYGGAISRGVAKMEKDELGGASADKVARVVVKAAEKRRVRPLYTVGLEYRALAALAKLLPASTCRWILGLMYGK